MEQEELDRKKARHALFYSAAELGDAEQLRLLASAGTEVNCNRPDGSSALLLAALGGHTAACSELISLGADVHHKKSDGATAIFAAAAANAVECVRALHAAGAVLDTPNAAGVTPLQMAAHKNNAESLRLLLSLGADPCAADNAGNNAVHQAARSNALDALEGLLMHGSGDSDSNPQLDAELQRRLLMTNSAGQTPLNLALQAGAQDCSSRLLSAERAVSTALAPQKATMLTARVASLEAEVDTNKISHAPEQPVAGTSKLMHGGGHSQRDREKETSAVNERIRQVRENKQLEVEMMRQQIQIAGHNATCAPAPRSPVVEHTTSVADNFDPSATTLMKYVPASTLVELLGAPPVGRTWQDEWVALTVEFFQLSGQTSAGSASADDVRKEATFVGAAEFDALYLHPDLH